MQNINEQDLKIFFEVTGKKELLLREGEEAKQMKDILDVEKPENIWELEKEL